MNLKSPLKRPLWLWWLVVIAALVSLKVPASGLRDLKVYIPDTVLRGHNVQFNCTFTLEDEKLFAIKWYRGNYEIFRYIPSGDVAKKTFPLEGYNVSMEHSTGYVLFMYDAKFDNSGDYTCEVLADTTFDTLMFTKKMLVIDLPDDHPRITGVNEQYEAGEGITATCTAWHSNPPANLSWFINGEPAREAYLRRYNLKENYDDTFTSVLGLHFDVAKYHFLHGEMILKCTSSLLSVYWQSSEVRIRESNFHSSLIQGAQNFDRSHSHPKDPTPKTADSVNQLEKGQSKDNKMPVEQLTSHVLSSAAAAAGGGGIGGATGKAVNQSQTFLIFNLSLIVLIQSTLLLIR